MRETDKLRYDKECKQLEQQGYFVTANGVKSTLLDKKHRMKTVEDGAHKPKKVSSAYMYFFMEQQIEAKKKAGETKIDIAKNTREISATWKTYTDAQKEKYNK